MADLNLNDQTFITDPTGLIFYGIKTDGVGGYEDWKITYANLVGLTLPTASQGEILYNNGSAWVSLGVGTDGYALTTHSSGSNPTWEVNNAGDVVKVGTPVNNQVGVWTGNGTLEGDTGLTFDGTNLSVNSSVMVSNATHTGDVTGATALTIANGAVDIIMMSASGSATSSTFLRGDNTWSIPTGAGNVAKVGTPVNDQIGIWTGDGTIEGVSGLTYDGTNVFVSGNITLTGLVDGIDIAVDVAANTSKVTNVSTSLSAGTVTAITYGITSDGGANDIVLPEATTTYAGLLGANKWDEIVANTLKITTQWTTSGSDIYYNTGYVGIGTTTPDNKLTVYDYDGAPPSGSGTKDGSFSIIGHYRTLAFGTESISPYSSWIQARHTDSSNPTSYYDIALNPLGGNIGIGTTDPNYKLTVQSESVSGYVMNLKNSAGNEGIRFFLDGGIGTNDKGGLIILGDPSSGTWVTKVAIEARDGLPSYFNNGGNVGIGTTSPSEKLHVVGDIIATGEITAYAT